MKPWYFAHPISDYDTCFEQIIVERLDLHRIIENPNQPRHQEGYARWGMQHFLQNVLPSCCGCFFLAFPGGHIGAGVAQEVEYFLKQDLPVFEIVSLTETLLVPVTHIQERRILTREETRGVSKVLKTLGNGGRGYV